MTAHKRSFRGFTLVELLIVIAIIAVLAAVVALLVNPLELTRRGRDATRLSDLANLQQALMVSVEEATTPGLICNDVTNVTGSCTGESVGGTRSSDGTGWVAVKFTNLPLTIPVLPIDPTNTTAQHYRYCASWTASSVDFVFVTNLESIQQSPKEATDGNNDTYYQIGTNPNMSCTY